MIEHPLYPGSVNKLTRLSSLGDVVNAWRHTMDLDPVPRSEGPKLASTLQIPFTYCWSAALIPKPADWPSYIGRRSHI